MHLAWACEELGDLERGRALHQENLRRAQAAGNKRMEAMSLEGLAFHARLEGRTEESLALLRGSTHIVRDLGDPVWMANIFSRVAATLAAGGRAEGAAQLLSKSTALYEEIGSTIPQYVGKRNEETLNRIHTGLDADAFADAWARGRVLTEDGALDIAAAST
jgi:hypothetical protein